MVDEHAFSALPATPQELERLRGQVETLRRALAEAEGSEQRLELALWSAELAWWEWDVERGALAWSPRIMELLGYMPETGPGLDYPPPGSVHPEDLPRVREAMQHYLQGRRAVYQARYRVRTASNEWQWFQDCGRIASRDAGNNPLRVVGTLQDIGLQVAALDERERLYRELQQLNAELEYRVGESTEELRNANEELRVYQVELETQNEELRAVQLRLEESRSRLTHLYDFAPLAYFTLDRDGLILEANLKFAGMLGVQRNRLLLKPVAVFLASESQEPLYRFRMRLVDSLQPGTTELLMKRRDGESFFARLEGVPEMTFDGPTGRVRIAMMDISEQKQAEALREDVERMARHDLKTPLNAVINLPKLMLMDDNLTEEQREFLTQIEESGYGMLQIVNLSLDLFKMEQGTYDFTPGSLDLLGLIRKVSREMGTLARLKHLQLQVELDGRPAGADDWFIVQGEELLCYTMLANSLKNAYEASPEQGVVRVQLWNEAENHRIVIHNQGEVPPAVRQTFFEKYATAGKQGGTGLGTYSARLIARTHGGDIGFSTSEAEGTTLVISLPRRGT